MSNRPNLDKPHMVIIGLMGVGKSTLGTTYADSHGLAYVDSDDDIQRVFAASGSELAARWGVGALHEIEAGMLLGALASETPSVITAAASVVEKSSVIEALRSRATTMWLDGDIDETHRRQAAGSHRRPMELSELAALAERRRPMFEDAADLRLDASQSPAQLVNHIDEYLSGDSTDPTERNTQ